LALDLGFIPVVPPIKTRLDPWENDREMCKRRNEVERLFQRLEGYRRTSPASGSSMRCSSASCWWPTGFAVWVDRA
jgi:transposase